MHPPGCVVHSVDRAFAVKDSESTDTDDTLRKCASEVHELIVLEMTELVEAYVCLCDDYCTSLLVSCDSSSVDMVDESEATEEDDDLHAVCAAEPCE